MPGPVEPPILVLAGGEGTRLWALDASHPKPMPSVFLNGRRVKFREPRDLPLLINYELRQAASQ